MRTLKNAIRSDGSPSVFCSDLNERMPFQICLSAGAADWMSYCFVRVGRPTEWVQFFGEFCQSQIWHSTFD